MRSKILFSIFLLFLTGAAFAQWTQSTSFPGIPRARSTAFTIGSKTYVMGGFSNTAGDLKDFWEYDMITGTWTQKPDFPGAARYGAASFVIGASGYIATGANDNGYLDDLWQYNTFNNSWTVETSLPAGSAQHENQRTEAFAFSIGGKAYLGGGEGFVFGPNSTNNYAFPDLWEYDPNSNSWTEKSGFPDFKGRDMGVAVAVNNKAYIGLGCNVGQNLGYQEFWEYDPATDSWTARADFPTAFTTDAASFVYNSEIYILGGVGFAPVTLSDQFYKYDPVADTWTSMGNFNGGAIAGAFASASDSLVIAGTGFTGSLNTRSDTWKFPNITIPTGVGQPGTGPAETPVIYPNPATELLSLKANKEVTRMSVYDLQGRLVKEQNTCSMNIKDLSTGVYQLAVMFHDGSRWSHRFSKEQ